MKLGLLQYHSHNYNYYNDAHAVANLLLFQCQDHITLEDYEIHDGMSLELYYQ